MGRYKLNHSQIGAAGAADLAFQFLLEVIEGQTFVRVKEKLIALENHRSVVSSAEKLRAKHPHA